LELLSLHLDHVIEEVTVMNYTHYDRTILHLSKYINVKDNSLPLVWTMARNCK